ncbi:DUF3566 domain-containing protein [Arsenicicoccus cauae]|uniref:DUF3566 domain-containing protein n=1 Tax=Arsenicicoccus cauae TaxID=2663847 RepID=UPI002594CE12|nr:DUF3566 domain-containing protein [Arsenicicoccus cauae]
MSSSSSSASDRTQSIDAVGDTAVREPVRTSGGSASSAVSAPAAGSGTGSGRQAKLRVQRVDPLSVLKLAFLLSVAAGIAGVVLIAVLWMILNGMGVFSSINEMVLGLLPQGKEFDLMDYVGFSRVLSLSIVISFINILLLTALATLAAFLYNICAGLVGGVRQTLTDD